MTALGVPVPAGFTITTDACRAYMAAEKQVPDGLDAEVGDHIAALEQKAGNDSETRRIRCSSRFARGLRSRCRG